VRLGPTRYPEGACSVFGTPGPSCRRSGRHSAQTNPIGAARLIVSAGAVSRAERRLSKASLCTLHLTRTSAA
jgi:hypothetical protein